MVIFTKTKLHIARYNFITFLKIWESSNLWLSGCGAGLSLASWIQYVDSNQARMWDLFMTVLIEGSCGQSTGVSVHMALTYLIFLEKIQL